WLADLETRHASSGARDVFDLWKEVLDQGMAGDGYGVAEFRARPEGERAVALLMDGPGATRWDGVAPRLAALGVTALFAVLGRRRMAAAVWVLGFGAVWYLTVQSGLSTSLTAVAFALIVPVEPRRETSQSPLKDAMHDLHPYVAYLVLPLFAFAKAGVSFAGLSLEQAFAPLVIAIALGLFVGKQIGVFGVAWLAVKLGLGDKPSGAGWMQLYGVSLLCGIGFTMSLFIGVLAFPGAVDSPEQIEVKLGVIGGSVLSALMAAAILTLAEKGRKKRMVAHQSNI
ncbi:hypothetical protein LTR94_027668, partial [Friedmanniomyces endolithicus]